MKGSVLRKYVSRFFFILLGAASLSGVDLSPDHRKIEPFLLPTDQPAVAAAQRKMLEAIGSTDLSVPVFFHMKNDDPDFPARLGNLGGSGRPVHSRLYTGRIPRDAARYISNWAQVAYIESDKLARPLLDLSGPAVSADFVHAGTGLPGSFNGAGMYVGVVDTGLYVSHLDFHTGGAGSPHRVVHWYPDNVTASSDAEGHGTHVIGIASGNGFMSTGAYTGMAPGANILFGKTNFLTSDILAAIQSIIGFAQTNSKPVPVNLSLGLSVGPHDGTSAFESGLASIADAAGVPRIITVAAGNETGDHEHFLADIGPFGTVIMPITITGPPPPGVPGRVDIWADGADQYTVTATFESDVVTVPSGSSGSSPGGRISLSNRVGGPHPINGATYIPVTFNPPAGGGPATIQLDRTRNGKTGRVDAYVDNLFGGFGTATDAGMITEPANAQAVLAVGAFDTKSIQGGAPRPQNISSFSSLGPTRDGRVKPDITAPGFVIYSARSFDQNPVTDPVVPGNDNYFVMAGTSMSTPHVTGITALVWQSNPALTSAQMRERIRRTANSPTDGSAVPNNTWGYGKVNALAAIRNSVASITAPATAVPGSPVAMTSGNSSGAFGSPLTSYAWSLVRQPAGSSLTLSSTAPSASFTPIVPGDYEVGLSVSQAAPPLTLPGTATAVVHVNNIPTVSSISGPAAADNLAPVTFSGAGNDPEGQQLVFHWVLVSRPAGSASSLTTADVNNVTLAPDVAGNYEVGLKVDDRLDNSALAIHSFSASGTLPPSSGGSGGGCSIADSKGPGTPFASTTAIMFFLLPAGVLAARKRIIRTRLRVSRIPPPGPPGAP
jgi:subtilisin family serine protease